LWENLAGVPRIWRGLLDSEQHVRFTDAWLYLYLRRFMCWTGLQSIVGSVCLFAPKLLTWKLFPFPKDSA
jgi:hypothetical protein